MADSGEPTGSRAVARRVIVRGHVQGVFFRDSARRQARTLGVVGWITNRPDGNVEAWLEGEPAAVQQMIDYCRHGPRGARVANLEVRECEPAGHRRFEVR